jgi:hypothetical protein
MVSSPAAAARPAVPFSKKPIDSISTARVMVKES